MADSADTPTPKEPPINAHPTKAFFVEMLVRDIPLEQAVLDLVDNCIDGAKRQQGQSAEAPFAGYSVTVNFDKEHFQIRDNCGGFSKAIARDYAFRFGRTQSTPTTAHSIGQFGVGMKRALFKFGRHFIVRSATKDEEWAIDVPVTAWECIARRSRFDRSSRFSSAGDFAESMR